MRSPGCCLFVSWNRQSVNLSSSHLMNLNSHCISSGNATLVGYWRSACVAANIVGRHVGDWAVGQRKSDTLSAIVDTVDPEILKGGMGSDLPGGKRSDNSKECRLHREDWYLNSRRFCWCQIWTDCDDHPHNLPIRVIILVAIPGLISCTSWPCLVLARRLHCVRGEGLRWSGVQHDHT